MKNFFAITILTLSALVFTGCPKDKDGGVREIPTSENEEADLGTINEADGLAQVKLIVKNTTGDTLRPLKTYSHCSCVQADVSLKPVAPGENLVVDVAYNPAYRSGVFMEEVQVYYNDPHHVLGLIIKGVVNPMEHPIEEDYPYDFGSGLHLSHEALHFGVSKPLERKEMFIRLVNDSNKQMNLELVPDPSIAGNFRPRSISLAEGARDTLHLDFIMPEGYAPKDTLISSVDVLLDGKKLDKQLIVKAIASSK